MKRGWFAWSTVLDGVIFQNYLNLGAVVQWQYSPAARLASYICGAEGLGVAVVWIREVKNPLYFGGEQARAFKTAMLKAMELEQLHS